MMSDFWFHLHPPRYRFVQGLKSELDKDYKLCKTENCLKRRQIIFDNLLQWIYCLVLWHSRARIAECDRLEKRRKIT
ncbi:hypothetical protein ACOSP7_020204 [Xanthoceras sorbifolium]